MPRETDAAGRGYDGDDGRLGRSEIVNILRRLCKQSVPASVATFVAGRFLCTGSKFNDTTLLHYYVVHNVTRNVKVCSVN